MEEIITTERKEGSKKSCKKEKKVRRTEREVEVMKDRRNGDQAAE